MFSWPVLCKSGLTLHLSALMAVCTAWSIAASARPCDRCSGCLPSLITLVSLDTVYGDTAPVPAAPGIAQSTSTPWPAPVAMQTPSCLCWLSPPHLFISATAPLNSLSRIPLPHTQSFLRQPLCVLLSADFYRSSSPRCLALNKNKPCVEGQKEWIFYIVLYDVHTCVMQAMAAQHTSHSSYCGPFLRPLRSLYLCPFSLHILSLPLSSFHSFSLSFLSLILRIDSDCLSFSIKAFATFSLSLSWFSLLCPHILGPISFLIPSNQNPQSSVLICLSLQTQSSSCRMAFELTGRAMKGPGSTESSSLVGLHI